MPLNPEARCLESRGRAERLAEKRDVIEHCFGQYKHDKTIDRLVNERGKYEATAGREAAVRRRVPARSYKYANALRALKAGYRK